MPLHRWILSLALLCILSWACALWGYANYIRALDARGKADIATEAPYSIVVLTGGGQRIQTGQDLLIAGVAPELFISGVGTGVRMQDILPNLPEYLQGQVTLGRKANDTRGNAKEVAEWLNNQARTPSAMVLVTGHYHLPRALLLFQRTMPQIHWLPYAVQPNILPLDDWYQSFLGWRLFSKELLKFIMEFLR